MVIHDLKINLGVGGSAMRAFLCAAVAIAILAMAAGSVGAGPEDDIYENLRAQPATAAADIVQIYELQASFHRAASAKDLTLMMSLWADDATFTTGNQAYKGKGQIRTWFANVAGPFRPQNQWVSLTPSQRIRISVQGDHAILYFECHYVDVKTGAVKSQVAADTTLIRSAGRWVIKDLKAGPANLSQ